MEHVPLAGRPKVGQRVLLRRWIRVPDFTPSPHWEAGKIEIVRRNEFVYRSGYGYELTVKLRDLFEVPRHWGKR